MLSTIFSIIVVILGILLMWGIFILILSLFGAAIKVIISTPIFWAAFIGGLVAYLLGYQSDQSIINGMIWGGGVMALIMVCSWIGSYSIFKIIGWTFLGVAIGYFLGMMIFLGIVGLVIGIYQVCK